MKPSVFTRNLATPKSKQPSSQLKSLAQVPKEKLSEELLTILDKLRGDPTICDAFRIGSEEIIARSGHDEFDRFCS